MIMRMGLGKIGSGLIDGNQTSDYNVGASIASGKAASSTAKAGSIPPAILMANALELGYGAIRLMRLPRTWFGWCLLSRSPQLWCEPWAEDSSQRPRPIGKGEFRRHSAGFAPCRQGWMRSARCCRARPTWNQHYSYGGWDWQFVSQRAPALARVLTAH